MSNKSRPFAFKLLEIFCPAYLYEEIEGDLIHRFNKDLKEVGEKRAKRRLLWNVIRFCRPGIVLRNKFSVQLMALPMFQNYLKTGIRNLMRRKVYSFITVFGLAMSLAVCLVIWRYVEFERSYDDFHKNKEQIYRAVFTGYENGEKVYSSPYFGYGLGPSLLQDMPEVKMAVRTRSELALLSYTDKSSNVNQFEESVQFVDSTFLDVFSYEVIMGDRAGALNKPSSIVLTRSAARRYFGEDDNVIGEIIQIHTSYGVKGAYEVTAVIEDVPENSHLTFEFLIPIHNLLQIEDYKLPRAEWDWVNFVTYVLVHPNTSVASMNSKTEALLTKYTGPNAPGSFIFSFQPLRDIHVAEQEDNLFSNTYFYLLISFFILAIAGVNYINLSTARAVERAKEVGVKKAMGVSRSQLVGQFLTESLLINFLSLTLAVLIAMYLLPLLGSSVGKSLSFDLTQRSLWITLMGLFIIGTAITGIYPALVLSSFKTVNVIKGQVASIGSVLSFRKALIVFQFASSLILIVGTVTIYRQIDFMLNHEKGMNMEQMLVVDGPKVIFETESEQRLVSFKNQLASNTFVKGVTSSGATPGDGYSLVTGMRRLGAEDKPNQRETVYVVNADYDFIETYDINLSAGRAWNKALITDRKAVLINEAALHPFRLGDAKNALNEKLIIGDEDTVAILGVFRDVHWNSLHTANVPLLLWPQQVSTGKFSIHLNGNTQSALAKIEHIYKQTFPGNPFSYYFLNDFFDKQYKADQQFGEIITVFSVLALIIACLGLWGLASFTTLQRSKEVSIRKILGASVNHIVALLSHQYLKLLLIASTLSLPIIWYGINTWLNNYAFRIDLTWDLFLLPVGMLITLALATVSFQTIKAALTNPVNNLRNE